MCHSYSVPFNCTKCGEISRYCECNTVCEYCGEPVEGELNSNGTCANCCNDYEECVNCETLTHVDDLVDGLCCDCGHLVNYYE